jgi:pimeloyl-ACP methyl ester carboxylesterase
VPQGSSDVIGATGHAAHLEKPELAAARVIEFLDA